MSDNQERDTNQRALGCISFSMLAHVGLLTLLAITPRMNDPFGVANGSGGSMAVDLQTPGSSEPAAGSESNTTMGPQGEQLLADANDPNAVAIPVTQQTTTTQPATAAETKPAPQTSPPVETQDAAPVTVPAPTTVAKVQAPPKPEPKPEPVPEPKSAPKVKVAKATRTGDVPVQRPARRAPKVKPVSLADADAAADDEKNQESTNTPIASFTPETVQNNAPIETSTSAQDYPEQARTQTEAEPQVEPQTETMSEPMVAANEMPPSRRSSYSAGTTASAGGSGGASAPGANGSGANGPAPTGPAGGYGSPNGMQVRDSSQLAQMPGNRPPMYPLDDRRAHREGTVVLVAEILNDGSVGSVAIERSSGSRTLDEAALQAYRRWKYYPGQKGWVRHPFSFQLTD